MNLEELLKKEAEKHLSLISEVLSSGNVSAKAKDLELSLHTLKGDLSYVKDQKIMEDLELLRQECEIVCRKDAGSGTAYALELLESIRKRLLIEPVRAESLIAEVEARLKSAARNISSKLGKHIVLDFESNFDHVGLQNALFLKRVITPLVMNSCVHGIEKDGRIQVRVMESESGVTISVRDDGTKKGVPNEKEKMYSGQGLGLLGLTALVEERGGNVEALSGPGQEVHIRIPKNKAVL